MKYMNKSHCDERGATLIEVLVAILLLTVGLLAMAALTVNATNFNKMAQIRGTGTMLVNDYAERARANVFGFDRGGYAKTSAVNGTLTSPSLPSVNNAEAVAADKMAEFDQAEWLQEVARDLLNATPATCPTAASAPTGTRCMFFRVAI